MTSAASRTSSGDPGLLDEAPHVSWLVEGPARDEHGGVWSWTDGQTRGFPYLEAAGLLLSLHAEALGRGVGSPRIEADARRIAGWILPRLDRGVVAHKGARYAFDTAIVVAGLDRWSRVASDPDPTVELAVAGGRRFLRSCLAEQIGQRGKDDDGHWSRAFGPHLLKLVVALDDPSFGDLGAYFLETCWDGDHFRTHAASLSWYAHAHAYALEGFLALRAKGYSVDMSVVDAGLDSLRRVVRETATSTDVAAQLVRLGLLRGWSRDDEGLQGAWELIAGRTCDSGGVLYLDDVDHQNTWVTVFTAQAKRWSRLGPDPFWLA